MDFDAALPETRITITQRLKEILKPSRKVKSDVDHGCNNLITKTFLIFAV